MTDSARILVVDNYDSFVYTIVGYLKTLGATVTVVLVSDGAHSHPGSRAWSAAARASLRLGEMREALAALGVDPARLHTLGCPDGAVPAEAAAPGFTAAAEALAGHLARAAPQLVITPWRRDRHPDHRAAHALTRAALALARARTSAGDGPPPLPRVLEYPVWAALDDDDPSAPRPDEVTRHTLGIGRVVARKVRALSAHHSQLGLVIDDDPHGFTLPPALIARCSDPAEHYFEAHR